MASIVEDTFKDLKLCIQTKQGTKAKLCISNILRFFKGEVTSSEIDFALSIIFNEDDGIIPFIKQHISEVYLQESIKFSLDLLLLLVEELPIKIREHIKEISKISIKTLYTDKMAKEKSIALQILVAIVNNKEIVDLLDINYVIAQVVHHLEYGKLSSLVYEQLFPLLGILARDFPYEMQDHVSRVQVLLYSQFETQTKNLVNTKLRIIHGILTAFENMFCTFAPDPEIDTEECLRLYNMLKTMSYPGDVKFRPAFRAALSLLTKHGNLVSEHLYKDCLWWHNTLQSWLKLSWEDISIAVPAIEVFHIQIAKVLLIKKELKVLLFFINFFKTQLQTEKIKTYELRIVIRGFGTFSSCCSALLSQDDIIPLYKIIIQQTEVMYTSETQHKSIQNLPEYLESLSIIISHMPSINNVHLKALQNLIVILFQEFHQLSGSHHNLCIESLMKTFFNITQINGCFYEEVLEVTIYHGVIGTCSHPIAIESFEENEDFYKNNISYKNFLPLWIGLLSQKDGVQKELSLRIYDNIMKAFFAIINKLDLSTKRKVKNKSNDDDILYCDIKSSLEPNKLKDYHIFINMWIPTYLKEVINCSYKFPIASGFYKLSSYGLDFCDICEYFDHYEESEEKSSCYVLVLNFLQVM
ncbi:DNA-dependent protein kinase catalytic subunit-like [Ctenocephalides felis]|uniref:DNA-dependent protein kinase catalytic subunit-like n=1 Tax=Ctenocephalides felis TaxID=7515 RepID=UPI000E6E1DBE|nr:DNA-dependent protein kinase catalytic subunit-like [Ctenocephalides felis]